MPFYKAHCSHDGLQAGETYEFDKRDEEFRADVIAEGRFLTKVADEWNGHDALDWPEPEVLSTVGQPEPDE